MGYLKQLGLEKNTLIVIHSDNGPLVEKYPELEDSYGKFGLGCCWRKGAGRP